MLDKKNKLEDIRIGFAFLQNYIRPGGPMNLSDINIFAEDFVADVLNGLHGWNLKNTNRNVSNFPCIDLVDDNAGIGIQVSSQEGSLKINEALDCLEKHGFSKRIKQFYHFTLLEKQGSYTIHNVPSGISFTWKTDVLDFDSVLLQIQAASEQSIDYVQRVVRKSLPAVFATEINRLATLRTELHACQTIFDREVLVAPFQNEDPVEMYTAIREMRISLQQRGASRIPHDAVAGNFTLAKKVLRDCANEVRTRFPNVHAAAVSGSPANYQGNEFSDAINLMINIRNEIIPLIEANDRVLAEVDLRLS